MKIAGLYWTDPELVEGADDVTPFREEKFSKKDFPGRRGDRPPEPRRSVILRVRMDPAHIELLDLFAVEWGVPRGTAAWALMIEAMNGRMGNLKIAERRAELRVRAKKLNDIEMKYAERRLKVMPEDLKP